MSRDYTAFALSIVAVALVFVLRPVRRFLWWRFARIEARSRRRGHFLCPQCIRPISRHLHFCQRCGTPLTGFAATDPVKSILAQGEVYRRALRRPSKIVVAGIWILAFPPALGLVVYLLEYGRISEDSLEWAIIVILTCILAVRVTLARPAFLDEERASSAALPGQGDLEEEEPASSSPANGDK